MCTGDANAYGKRVDKEVGHAGMAPGYIELSNLDQAHEPNEKQGRQNGSARIAKSERKSHEEKSNEMLEAVGEHGHRPIRGWNEREDGNCEKQKPGGNFARLSDPRRGHIAYSNGLDGLSRGLFLYSTQVTQSLQAEPRALRSQAKRSAPAIRCRIAQCSLDGRYPAALE